MYVVLGCGTVGLSVLRSLKGLDALAIGVDRDGARAAAAREKGFDVLVGDMTEVDYGDGRFSEATAFVITVSDAGYTDRTVSRIRSTFKDPSVHIIAMLSSAGALGEGPDEATHVMLVQERLTEDILKLLDEEETRRRVDVLVKTLDGAREGDDALGGVAIFMHDNPDPDAMASAMALSKICGSRGVRCGIFHGGSVDRQENKEFVRQLHLRLERVEDAKAAMAIVGSFTKVALVDTAVPGENNVLPPTVVPNIVIDHHGVRRTREGTEFMEVSPHVGATSTIITKYLQELGIGLDRELATGLFLGIMTDTSSFTRGVSPADLMAVAFLSPFVHKPLIDLIESPPVPTGTIDVMKTALDCREVAGGVSVSWLGDVPDQGSIVQAVELLFREEGVWTAIVAGVVGNKVHISARSRDQGLDLGAMMHRYFKGIGSAGGHPGAAGCQLDMDVLSKRFATDGKDLGKVMKETLHRMVRERT